MPSAASPPMASSARSRRVASPAASSSSPLQSLPPMLRPLVRAYLLGYASAVAPRLLTLVLQHISRRRRNSIKTLPAEHDKRSFTESARHILLTGLDLQRFPAFCAALVGVSSLLQEPLHKLITRASGSLSAAARLRLARWLSSFIAGWLSLQLLQSKEAPSHTRKQSVSSSTKPTEGRPQRKLAGRTLDLTLFAATRAIDVLVGELWSQHRDRRKAAHKWSRPEQFLTQMVDPLVFVASCAFIMWAWFFQPESLPASYNKWITSAATVDLRLIEALRRCKENELRYGEETGQAPLLGSMCADYKLPVEWGNPAVTIPFPCDIVHMGCGPSCEHHAVSRFARSWKWSMFTYLPLALAMQLRRPNRNSVLRALVSASRSSAFLATFITLFYYGVCLARSRIGPHLLGRDAAACQRIDGGICVGTGCFLCGWSILIESASRRKDMSLFVAPRAMATLLPRRYSLDKQWRETLAFAASTAVVFTCALENPRRVRGVLGGVLNFVLKK